MKAIFVSPAQKLVELIDIAPDVEAWKIKLGAERIDHQTLNLDLGLLAVVDDTGLAMGLPEYSIFASAMNTRIRLAGDTLVVKGDETDWLDASDSDIERLDICF